MKRLAFLLFLLNTQTVAENLKIGYIDINKVIENSSLYQSANNMLVEEFDPRKNTLIEQYDVINSLKEKVLLPNDVYDDSLYFDDLKQILDLNNNFQLKSEIWQQELNQRQYNLLSEIELIINNTINSYAVSENYDLIIYEKVAFVNDEINITKEIIAEIDKL